LRKTTRHKNFFSPPQSLSFLAQRRQGDAGGALEFEEGDVVDVLGYFEVGAGLGEAELGVADLELGDLAGLLAFARGTVTRRRGSFCG